MPTRGSRPGGGVVAVVLSTLTALVGAASDAGAQGPVVGAVQPAAGPTAGGQFVTVDGSGFVSGATLHLGPRQATTVVVESPTRITAMSPAGAAGAARVTVTNPDGGRHILEDAYAFSAARVLPERQLEVAFAESRFDDPVYLTHAGDGTDRIFVVELAGRIRVLPNDPQARATDFLDLRARVADDVSAQAGLLSLAFHPGYAANGRFYVYYSSGGGISRLSELRVSTDPERADPASERVVLEVQQTGYHHNGNHLAFGPDGMLYASQGTGGLDEDHGNGQDPTNLKGTIYRIDVDGRTGDLGYAIPADNPFVGNDRGWREEIWSYGMRNPWRFSFDRATGHLWEGDVAWGLWEEINLIEAGGNYGWVTMEGHQCLSRDMRNQAVAGCDKDSFAQPLFVYGHTAGAARSVTGGYVYRGARVPGLRGVYLYGDFVTHQVWGLRTVDGQVAANDLLATLPSGVVSFGEDEAGEVYVVGFEDGRIYAFAPLPDESPTAVVEDQGAGPTAAALHPAWPNPFNPRTVIPYSLPAAGRVRLTVYGALGQRLATLVDGVVPAGPQQAAWDGRDDAGRPLASGVYLCRMEAEGFARTQKLLLMR